jgi:hypothetical protein
MTRVSVGLPVYNGERYLECALNSLVAQSHADLEIIISDNASTDRTEEICRAFAAQDKRIRYIRQPENRGGAFNHTFVAEQATAPYFRWYSYDDWMGPECISEGVRVLDENQDVVLAWTEPTPVYTGLASKEYDFEPMWDDRTAVTRLRSLLRPPSQHSLIGWCYPIYGLIRREQLIQSLPMGAFFGSDNVILVSWAIGGKWRKVAPGQFFCRRHDSMSTAGKSRHEVARWMSTTMTPGRSMPECRRFIGYLRAVLRSDLTVIDRMRCSFIVFGWPLRHRHWRFMLWDLRILVAELSDLGRDGTLPRSGVAARIRRLGLAVLRVDED